MKHRGIITLLDILPLIDTLPVVVDKVSKIMGYLSCVMHGDRFNFECDQQLIRYVLEGDYKKFKRLALSECFFDFTCDETKEHHYSRINKIEATYLLGVYYIHTNKTSKAIFYLKLCKYLGANISQNLLEILEPTKTEQLLDRLGKKDRPCSNLKLVDDNSRYLLHRHNYYYFLKIDKTGNTNKYLPRCLQFFNIVDRYVGKRITKAAPLHNLYSGPLYHGLFSGMLLFYEKNGHWEDYCKLANRALVLNIEVRMVVADLLNNKEHISDEEWKLLPYLFSSYDNISRFCETSNLYKRLKVKNSESMTKYEDYIVRICVYLWSNVDVNLLQKNSTLEFLLMSHKNKLNSPLFLLLDLFTINLPKLYDYKTTILGQLDVDRLTSTSTSTSASTSASASASASTPIEISPVDSNRGADADKWINVLTINKDLLELNLKILYENALQVFEPFTYPDVCAYLFVHLFQLLKLQPDPSKILIGVPQTSEHTKLISIRRNKEFPGQNQKCCVSEIGLSLKIWKQLYNKVRKGETYQEVVQLVPNKSLNYLMLMLSQIENIKTNIIGRDGGIDYIRSKGRFENNTTNGPHCFSKTNQQSIDELTLVLQPNNIKHTFDKHENNLSEVDHSVFSCLFIIAKFGQNEDTKNLTEEMPQMEYITNINILIKEFKSTMTSPKFLEVCNYYLKCFGRRYDHYDVQYYCSNLLEKKFCLNLLENFCLKINHHEGLLKVHSMFRQLRISSQNVKQKPIECYTLCEYVNNKIKIMSEICKHNEINTIIASEDLKLPSSYPSYNNILTILEHHENYKKYEKFVVKIIRLLPPPLQ